MKREGRSDPLFYFHAGEKRKMAGFKNYEDMKKPELIEMCRLFGIEVHAKDTKQALIDKLNSKDAQGAEVRKEAPAQARSSRRTGRSRKRPTAEEKEKAEKKAAIKEYTEDIMDSYADKPIEGLAPKTYKKARKVNIDTEAFDRVDRELAASAVDPYHTLKGKMLGPKSTEVRIINGERIEFVNYMVSYGPYNILIPSFKFWYDWDDQNAHPVGRLYEQGAAMEGAEIEFNMFRREEGVVTEIFGTRLYATKIKRCEQWYSKLSNGDWYIEEGSLQEATVLRTRPYDVVVEVYGAETSIPIKEVSHFYDTVVDAKKYPPGKKITVRVSNIRREPIPRNTARFDFPVKFDASIKAATVNPQIVYFDNYDEGDLLPAVITNIKEYEGGGKYLYYCNINDQIVAAADLGPGAGRGKIPEIGSEVKIRIVDKNRKKMSFYGLIVNVKDKNRDSEVFAVIDTGK